MIQGSPATRSGVSRLPAWSGGGALLLVLLLACLVSAQSTQPAGSVYDGQPLKKPRSPSASAAATPTSEPFDWQRLVLAMGIVLGLIFALRFVVARMYPSVGASKGVRIVRVLTRSPIAPKQQVLLLQVGRRVVVVADSAGTLSTLSEITDPDEVASLVGQVENVEVVTPRSPFSRMFSRAQEDYTDAPAAIAPTTMGEVDAESPQTIEEVENAQTEISGLIDRMRALTKTVRRNE